MVVTSPSAAGGGSSEGAVGAATGELREKLSKATCVANGKLRSSAPKKLKVNISP